MSAFVTEAVLIGNAALNDFVTSTGLSLFCLSAVKNILKLKEKKSGLLTSTLNSSPGAGKHLLVPAIVPDNEKEQSIVKHEFVYMLNLSTV